MKEVKIMTEMKVGEICGDYCCLIVIYYHVPLESEEIVNNLCLDLNIKRFEIPSPSFT